MKALALVLLFAVTFLACVDRSQGYAQVISMVCEARTGDTTSWIRCPYDVKGIRNRAKKDYKFCCGELSNRRCCTLVEKLSEDPKFDPIGRDDTVIHYFWSTWQILILICAFVLFSTLCLYFLGWTIFQVVYCLFCCPCFRSSKNKNDYYSYTEESKLISDDRVYKAPVRSGGAGKPLPQIIVHTVEAQPIRINPDPYEIIQPPPYSMTV